MIDEALLRLAKTVVDQENAAQRAEICLLCSCPSQGGHRLLARNHLDLGDNFGSLFHGDCWELWQARNIAQRWLSAHGSLSPEVAKRIIQAEEQHERAMQHRTMADTQIQVSSAITALDAYAIVSRDNGMMALTGSAKTAYKQYLIAAEKSEEVDVYGLSEICPAALEGLAELEQAQVLGVSVDSLRATTK